jgi:hypothetical protein
MQLPFDGPGRARQVDVVARRPHPAIRSKTLRRAAPLRKRCGPQDSPLYCTVKVREVIPVLEPELACATTL